MRTKLIALALAVMLAIGTGGVVAAGASSGTTQAEQFPDDYTVDVTDPFDQLSSDEVEEAIETVWSNERVQSNVDSSDDVHFNVVAGAETVQVGIAPGPVAEDRAVAKIGPDGTVAEVFEPTVTTDDSTTVDFSGPVDLSEDRVVIVSVENGESAEWNDDEESLTAAVEVVGGASTNGSESPLINATVIE